MNGKGQHSGSGVKRFSERFRCLLEFHSYCELATREVYAPVKGLVRGDLTNHFVL
jgi:hypothetical protein